MASTDFLLSHTSISHISKRFNWGPHETNVKLWTYLYIAADLLFLLATVFPVYWYSNIHGEPVKATVQVFPAVVAIVAKMLCIAFYYQGLISPLRVRFDYDRLVGVEEFMKGMFFWRAVSLILEATLLTFYIYLTNWNLLWTALIVFGSNLIMGLGYFVVWKGAVTAVVQDMEKANSTARTTTVGFNRNYRRDGFETDETQL